MRLSEGPPHLALNPPLLIFVFFLVLSFVLEGTKNYFPSEKGIFAHFLSVELPFFTLSFAVSLFLFSFFLSFLLSFFLSFSLFYFC